MVIFSRIFSLMLLCSNSVVITRGTSIGDVQALKQYLLSNLTYDRTVRPLFNQSTAIEVTISWTILYVSDLSVTTGLITLHGYITTVWRDQIMQWNPSDYGDIRALQLTNTDVWVPALAEVFDTNSNTFKATSALELHSNGTVVWAPRGLLHGVCDQKMDYYPFDEQTCHMDVIATIHDIRELRLKVQRSGIRMLHPKNGQWIWVKGTSHMETMPGTTIFVFGYFKNTFTFRRKPEFILIHTVVPIQFLLFLNLFVYSAPTKGGERISFSITLMLAFVFYASYITEKVPESSISISVVSKLTVVSILISSFTFASSVITCKLASDYSREIPNWLRRITMKSQNLLCDNRNHARNKNTETESDEVKEVQAGLEINDKRSGVPISDANGTAEGCITWVDVSRIVDHLCFYITLCATVITIIVGLSALLH